MSHASQIIRALGCLVIVLSIVLSRISGDRSVESKIKHESNGESILPWTNSTPFSCPERFHRNYPDCGDWVEPFPAYGGSYDQDKLIKKSEDCFVFAVAGAYLIFTPWSFVGGAMGLWLRWIGLYGKLLSLETGCDQTCKCIENNHKQFEFAADSFFLLCFNLGVFYVLVFWILNNYTDTVEENWRPVLRFLGFVGPNSDQTRRLPAANPGGSNNPAAGEMERLLRLEGGTGSVVRSTTSADYIGPGSYEHGAIVLYV